jgi:hypothetical protein
MNEMRKDAEKAASKVFFDGQVCLYRRDSWAHVGQKPMATGIPSTRKMPSSVKEGSFRSEEPSQYDCVVITARSVTEPIASGPTVQMPEREA